MKNVLFPAKSVHVGQNYVFYSSLLKDDPILANKAQTVLASQSNELTFSESSQNKMSAMVHFFDVVIKREQNNEKLFLQRQREKFKDMPNFQTIFKLFCNCSILLSFLIIIVASSSFVFRGI